MSDIAQYTYNLRFKVRDYELDAEGIVNNANYLHYLEMTRHEFCYQAGVSFTRMRQQGIEPVLRRVEIDYLTPLRGDDEAISCLILKRQGARFIFIQDIYRANDMQPVVKAIVTCVELRDGHLTRGDALAESFADYL